MNYEVLDQIGEGSLTTVYKVRRRGIEEVFAAKVLRSEFASNARTARRFLQEAQKAVKLNNAHLVSVYETGKTGTGEPYLICDRFDGGNLADRLSQTGRMAQVEVLDVFLQVAEGLNHAHKSDVIHRDIKPANIVFKTGAAAELVKMADFGIAKVLPGAGRETKYFTPFGEAFGNPSYMSPEQLQGARLDARADIYSLGCVMYECLCGKPPFTDDNAVKVAVRQINEQAQPLRSQAPDVKLSAGMEAIVMRMLEKNVIHRYQSVEELIDDLKLVRAGGSPRPVAPPPAVAQQVGGKAQAKAKKTVNTPSEDDVPEKGSIIFNRHLARCALDRGDLAGADGDEDDADRQAHMIQLWPPPDWLIELMNPVKIRQNVTGQLLQFRRTSAPVFADRGFLVMILAGALFLSFCSISILQYGQNNIFYQTCQDLGFFGGRPRTGLGGRPIGKGPVYYAKTGSPAFSQTQQGKFFADRQLLDVREQVIFNYSAGHLRDALTEAVANGVDLSGANLDNQSLYYLSLAQARLSGASMRGCDLMLTDLTRANLKGALLNNANLRHCKLRYANLQGAELGGANLGGAEMAGANLIDVTRDGSLLTKEMLIKLKPGESKPSNMPDQGTGQNWRNRFKQESEDKERWRG